MPDEHCVELTVLLPEAHVVADKDWDRVPLTHTVPVAEAQEELDTLLLWLTEWVPLSVALEVKLEESEAL